MLETYDLDTDTLNAYEGNPRQGDVGAIVESLKANGQYRAIVVNRGTLTGRPWEVLAGNHTLQAAVALNWPTIAAHVVDLDADAARRIVLVDNRANDLSTNDDRALLDLLLMMPDLEGTGYGGDDLDDLTALLESHTWEDEGAQDAIDTADESGWPSIKAKLPPHNHARFMNATGGDDESRILDLLQRAGL